MEWRIFKEASIDGVDFVIKERTDSRNRHGSLEYVIEVYIGGKYIFNHRVGQNIWIGHCDGQLLLPELAKRAKLMEGK